MGNASPADDITTVEAWSLSFCMIVRAGKSCDRGEFRPEFDPSSARAKFKKEDGRGWP